MTGDLVPISPDLVTHRAPVEVLDTDGINWDDIDPDNDEDFEHTHRGPLTELIDTLLADIRDASTRLDELDAPAREVGRWLHGRLRHAALQARRLR